MYNLQSKAKIRGFQFCRRQKNGHVMGASSVRRGKVYDGSGQTQWHAGFHIGIYL